MSTQGKVWKDPFATPYYVDVNEDGLHYEVRGKNAHGLDATVARCVLLVNAEFIRDACNAHAELIDVLAGIVKLNGARLDADLRAAAIISLKKARGGR